MTIKDVERAKKDLGKVGIASHSCAGKGVVRLSFNFNTSVYLLDVKNSRANTVHQYKRFGVQEIVDLFNQAVFHIRS